MLWHLAFRSFCLAGLQMLQHIGLPANYSVIVLT